MRSSTHKQQTHPDCQNLLDLGLFSPHAIQSFNDATLQKKMEEELIEL